MRPRFTNTPPTNADLIALHEYLKRRAAYHSEFISLVLPLLIRLGLTSLGKMDL